jgi:hypothetical protein
MANWNAFVSKLRLYPNEAMSFQPPCTPDRIASEETRLGTLPSDLRMMLEIFNGAELFVGAMPFLTLFGLSLPDDPADLTWYIDRFTPTWRARMNRPSDWVYGMTNYGGIVIYDRDEKVVEWDGAQQKWCRAPTRLEEWFDDMLREGAKTYSEE